MWMFWLGVAIVIMTFWLIFKNYEARTSVQNKFRQNHARKPAPHNT